MTRPERRQELDKQFEEQQKLHEQVIEEHPATNLIKSIRGNSIGDPEIIHDALLYLLERAREEDVGH